MTFYYLSPGVIPSKNAYSINIINQCLALSKTNKVVLITFNNNSIKSDMRHLISKEYGLFLNKNFTIKTFSSKFKIFSYFRVILFLFFNFLSNNNKVIFSRNLYISFFISLLPLKVKHIYEIHHPSFSFRELIQKKIIYNDSIKKIFITSALKKYYFNNKLSNSIILPDAAEEFSNLFNTKTKMKLNKKYSYLNSFRQNNVGYFGSLYSGRGIEKIIKLANKLPMINFFIIGGPEEYLENYNIPKNLYAFGYLPYQESRYLMKKMSLLLIPYTHKTKVNSKYISTAKWMSPLKIFEYMSSKRLIVSNNINVLREILNNQNSIILNDNINDWCLFLNTYFKNRDEYNKLPLNAFKEFKQKYTWTNRSKKIINFIKYEKYTSNNSKI